MTDATPKPVTPPIGTRVTIYRGSHKYPGRVTEVFEKYCTVEFTRRSGNKESARVAVYEADAPWHLIPDRPGRAIITKFQG